LGSLLFAVAVPLSGWMPVDWLTASWFYPMEEHLEGPGEESPYEELRVALPGGQELDAWWFPSRVAGAEPRGVVVQAHGNAGNLSTHWRGADRFPDLGYHVLCFDYRGFGRSDGEVSRQRAVEDLGAVLDHAGSLARKEGLPLVLLGQSIGAALSLEVAPGRTDLQALIVDSPFDSWPGIAWYHLGKGRWHGPVVKLFLNRLFHERDREPLVSATRLSGLRVLVIGGGADAICPPAMARRIHEAATGSDFLLLEGAPHVGLREESHETLVDEALQGFLSGLAAPGPSA
jgi:pimeloyl-ACP methyl ester carboxylesterase